MTILRLRLQLCRACSAVSLKSAGQVRFSSLKKPAVVPPWRHAQLEQSEPAPAPDAFRPAPPTGLSKIFGKSKYEQEFEQGRMGFERAVQEHAARERQRTATLAQARAQWQAAVDAANTEAHRQHTEIDAFEAEYRRGVQDAVAAYCSMVLEASQYPSGFPQEFRLAYVPESRQAVVEYELPTVAVVPAVKAYKYVKTSDTITETPRPQTQVKALYARFGRAGPQSAQSMNCWPGIQADTSIRLSSMASSTPRMLVVVADGFARAW